MLLHSPLCLLTNVEDVPIHLLDWCLAYIDRSLSEASRLVTMFRGVAERIVIFSMPMYWVPFMCEALINNTLANVSFLSVQGMTASGFCLIGHCSPASS